MQKKAKRANGGLRIQGQGIIKKAQTGAGAPVIEAELLIEPMPEKI
jgi:hypothetical protein